MTAATSFRRTVRRCRLRAAQSLLDRSPSRAPAAPYLDERVREELLGLLALLLLAHRADALAGESVDPDRLRRLTEADPGSLESYRELARTVRSVTGARATAVGPEDDFIIPTLSPSMVAELAGALVSAVREHPDLDHLGEMHQQFHSGELQISEGETEVVDGASRRASGLFYTPPPVVEHVADRAIRAATERRSGAMRRIRMLDPACGSGAFLCALFRRLVRRHRRARTFDDDLEMLRHVLRSSLCGVDRDGRAVELTRWNLRLAALEAANAPIPLRALAVDDSLHVGDALVFATPQEVRQIDARVGSGSPYDRALRSIHGLDPRDRTPLHWHRAFEDVLAGDSPRERGFDAVVGNPPWVSFGLRDAGSVDEPLDTYLRERFSGSAQYKLPMYPLFVELALRLCRGGGTTTLLLPDSFLTGSQFSNLRKTLLERATLDEISVIDDDLWPGSTAGRPVVVHAQNAELSEGEVRIRRVSTADALQNEAADEERPLRDIAQGPDHRFELLFDDASQTLVDSMRAASVPLGDRLAFYSGCIARHGQDSLRSSAPRRRWVVRDAEGEVVLEDDTATTRWRLLVPTGRDVRPFEIFRRGAVLYVPRNGELRRRIAKSGFDLDRYDAPKLFVRQTGHRLVAARDDRGAVCFNNLHVANARRRGVDLFAIAAILNSTPLRTFYRAVSLEGGRSLAQTAIDALARLPVPADFDPTVARLSDLARERSRLGTLLADWDRRFAPRTDAACEEEAEPVALTEVVESTPGIELRPGPGEALEGRVTDLRLAAHEGAVSLVAAIDGETREIATIASDAPDRLDAVFLGLRAMLRRNWRRRVWGRGRAGDLLSESIAIPPPKELELDPSPRLAAAATRAARLDDALDREVYGLYGVSPGLVDRAAASV